MKKKTGHSIVQNHSPCEHHKRSSPHGTCAWQNDKWMEDNVQPVGQVDIISDQRSTFKAPLVTILRKIGSRQSYHVDPGRQDNEMGTVAVFNPKIDADPFEETSRALC